MKFCLCCLNVLAGVRSGTHTIGEQSVPKLAEITGIGFLDLLYTLKTKHTLKLTCNLKQLIFQCCVQHCSGYAPQIVLSETDNIHDLL